jgi:DnaJ-class molecular chaperone
LDDYNEWFKAPWPSKEGTRPGLPGELREEIRVEANLECALCKTSGQTGEAAHIDPIKTSKNNHPHTLIWLCANHHTKFDNGCLGPKGATNEVVAALKIGLQHFKRTSWQGQAEVSRQIAATLSLCSLMQKKLETAISALEVASIEDIAKQALQLLPQLASQSVAEVIRPTLSRMTRELAEIEADEASSIKTRTRRRLMKVVSFETEFLAKSGLVQCPLCKGSKTHNGYDCPVCAGEGAVSKDLRVELDEFELISCQLCSGSGKHDGDDCPACGGDGRLERRVADRTDFSRYELVRCPLCKGKGRRNGEDCPECGGNREIPSWAADRVHLDKYDEVDCPRCEGSGIYEGDGCPECGGDRTMERRYADRVDLSKYECVDCPLCNGDDSFTFMDGDCPVCGGEMEIPKGAPKQSTYASTSASNAPLVSEAASTMVTIAANAREIASFRACTRSATHSSRPSQWDYRKSRRSAIKPCPATPFEPRTAAWQSINSVPDSGHSPTTAIGPKPKSAVGQMASQRIAAV